MLAPLTYELTKWAKNRRTRFLLYNFVQIWPKRLEIARFDQIDFFGLSAKRLFLHSSFSQFFRIFKLYELLFRLLNILGAFLQLLL